MGGVWKRYSSCDRIFVLTASLHFTVEFKDPKLMLNKLAESLDKYLPKYFNESASHFSWHASVISLTV